MTKSKTVKKLLKKRIQQQIKKKELLDFNWHENTTDDLKQTIMKMLIDLEKRRCHHVALKIKDVLVNHQDGIEKEKFDIF